MTPTHETVQDVVRALDAELRQPSDVLQRMPGPAQPSITVVIDVLYALASRGVVRRVVENDRTYYAVAEQAPARR